MFCVFDFACLMLSARLSLSLVRMSEKELAILSYIEYGEKENTASIAHLVLVTSVCV